VRIYDPGTVEEPSQVIDSGGKLQNGLYLRTINLYEDRVSFEVYASRPLRIHQDLAELQLTDTVGTEYVLVAPTDGELDGHGSIVFKPGLPSGAHLRLGRPGWGLHTYGT
jgi:hypothetical protein